MGHDPTRLLRRMAIHVTRAHKTRTTRRQCVTLCQGLPDLKHQKHSRFCKKDGVLYSVRTVDVFLSIIERVRDPTFPLLLNSNSAIHALSVH
jgi:hypothetical protein